MNRIQETFKQLKENGQKAFVPYIMAGDGGLGCLADRLLTLEKFGASLIEVGIPFSDPVADGPVIQQAGIRALANSVSLRDVIVELKRTKGKISVPILFMTYMNPILSYGVERFAEDIREAGIDGCIIPDLPVEEEDIIAPLLEKANVELIRLVTLATPPERIEMIAQKGNGFLYTVTVKGITGTRKEYQSGIGEFLQEVKRLSGIPVLAGFGVSNEEQARELASYCDGVVVGSRIVELFNENDLQGIEKLVTSLHKETNLI